jgi:tetratricopeptide (TPR) repeat protein
MKLIIFLLLFVFLSCGGRDYLKSGDEEAVHGNYSKAIEYFTKEIVKSNSPEAYCKRGNAYAKLQNYEAAIADLGKAVELKPDYAEAYNGRGIVFYELKQFDKAINDFSKAIELKPDFADAYFRRGDAYADSGKINEAINDYKTAILLNPAYQTREGRIIIN